MYRNITNWTNSLPFFWMQLNRIQVCWRYSQVLAKVPYPPLCLFGYPCRFHHPHSGDRPTNLVCSLLGLKFPRHRKFCPVFRFAGYWFRTFPRTLLPSLFWGQSNFSPTFSHLVQPKSPTKYSTMLFLLFTKSCLHISFSIFLVLTQLIILLILVFIVNSLFFNHSWFVATNILINLNKMFINNTSSHDCYCLNVLQWPWNHRQLFSLVLFCWPRSLDAWLLCRQCRYRSSTASYVLWKWEYPVCLIGCARSSDPLPTGENISSALFLPSFQLTFSFYCTLSTFLKMLLAHFY